MSDNNKRKFQTRMASAGFPPCPVTKKQFLELAHILRVYIDGCENKGLSLSPYMFKPGSFGWMNNTKVQFQLSDGTKIDVKLNINAVVIGSKEMVDWEAKLDNK